MARPLAATRRTLTALGEAARALFGFVPFLLNLLVWLPLAGRFRRKVRRLMAESGDRAPDTPEGGRRATRVYVIAGEESGDLHAANLVRALRAADPDVEVRGLGGPRLAGAGCALDYDLAGMSVMGILPVLRSVGTFFRLYRDLLRRLDEDPPDVLVPVDYPGFNLRIARRARRRGVRVAYYIAPQVWAWAPWRRRRIRRAVDRVLAILPFEHDLFAEAGIPCAFVGHPLFEHLEREAPRDPSRDGRGPVRTIGLLPGSRGAEVRALLPAMLRAARTVRGRHPGLSFVLPCRGQRVRREIERILARDGEGLAVRVSENRTHEEMREMDLALVASGTATLELAYYGVPMAVMYRLSRVAALFRPLLLTSPHVALVNIVAGREVVPEFVRSGDLAGPAEAALLRFVAEPDVRARTAQDLAEVRRRLTAAGVSARAAEWVLRAP